MDRHQRRSPGRFAGATALALALTLSACADSDEAKFDEVGEAVGDGCCGAPLGADESSSRDIAPQDDLAAGEADSPAPASTVPAPDGPPATTSGVTPADGIAANPWTDPRTDNRSTFGLDVDTGSYTIGRQWIETGMNPEPASVRPEEYVNALVDAPAHDGDEVLDLDAAGSTSPFAGGDGAISVLRVSMASEPMDPAARPDVDLTFVVDVSGSMDDPEKLPLVKESLDLLVGELRPTDTVALTVYGDTASVLLPPTAASARDAIVAAVDSMAITGSTNAEEGLSVGYATARATQSASAGDRVNRVILLSDGVANVGVSDGDGLVAQLRDDADAGIKLITVGYGLGEYNDPLMEQLADQGDGFYAYVDDIDEARHLFKDDLTGSLITVAEDARAQVTFSPDTVAEYRLIGYENRDIADDRFRDDTVDAGEIGAGHSVVAVYEVRLQPGVADDQLAAVADLRWLDPGSAESATETRVEISVAALRAPWSDTDETTRYAALAAAWAEAIGGRTLFTDRGNTVASVAAEVDAAASSLGGVGTFAEFQSLVDRSASF